MNPYALMTAGSGASTSSELAIRLKSWHDAMVGHERRLRTGRTDDVCDDECPHVEARSLWAEVLAAFGERAHRLSFLRSHALPAGQPAVSADATRLRESEHVASPLLRSTRMMAEAEL